MQDRSEMVMNEEMETAKETEKNGMRYEESGIDKRILRAVMEMGFDAMTPIQEQAIPVLMEGRDVIGQAQTGTGKTAAFGIPMLERMDEDNRNVQGIILCPTRELAIQAAEELRKFSKYMHGIKMVPIYGGQDITRQIKALKSGAQIVVGTPGRVMDHMRRHTIKMKDIKMVVLDEADEMLNMGFREDMETILSEIENEHQTALFSATMPQAILDITNEYQQDAELVKVTKKELTIPLVKQYYFAVKNMYKEEVTSRLLEMYGFKRSIIFCNTKRMVDELAENLKRRGYQAEGLHGDMTQKQRDFVMNRFKSGNLEILIATDVAARGIDVDDLEAVFNYDVPQDIEYYVHRIGRTGRAGKEGMAFTFAYGRELYRIRDIERICKTKMTEMKIPGAAQIMDIKINKVINTAAKKAAGQDTARLQEILEEKLAELEMDPMELLAALVRQQAGEEVQEIVIEEPRRRSGRPSEGQGYGREKRRETGWGSRRETGRTYAKTGRREADRGYGRDNRRTLESGYGKPGQEGAKRREAGKGDGYRKEHTGGYLHSSAGAQDRYKKKHTGVKAGDIRRDGSLSARRAIG